MKDFSERWILLHPRRLTWNIIMEVWNIIFLSKLVIWRFHVNLPGCKFCLGTWGHVGFSLGMLPLPDCILEGEICIPVSIPFDVFFRLACWKVLRQMCHERISKMIIRVYVDACRSCSTWDTVHQTADKKPQLVTGARPRAFITVTNPISSKVHKFPEFPYEQFTNLGFRLNSF